MGGKPKRLWWQIALIPLAILSGPSLAVLAIAIINLNPSSRWASIAGLPLLLALPVFFISCGIILYWMRENARISYGIAEIIFALLLIGNVLINGLSEEWEAFKENSTTPPPSWTILLLQVGAALYAMVRGLDNIGKALEEDTETRRVWRLLSLHPPESPAEQIQSAPDPDIKNGNTPPLE